jgi:lipid-A-disaccharide synthase-like uncharacterized protein
MTFISYLSAQIEKFAFFLNDLIISLFPFFASYLNDYPETIMIIIGFGGQALFAARFIIQWLSSESVGKISYSSSFLVFFNFRWTCAFDLCNLEKRSCNNCWSVCWGIYLREKFIFYQQRKKRKQSRLT